MEKDSRFSILELVNDNGGDSLSRGTSLAEVRCVMGLANVTTMDLCVMKEYDKGNSWTKLFNLRIADPDEQIRYIQPILVTETCTFLETQTASGSRPKLVRSYHKEEKIEEVHVRAGVIGYEESLLWLE